MRIGFIGTGAIAEAMIDGLCGPAGHDEQILVSERSRERSARLASKFETVSTAADNQRIVDESDLVVISVLPGQVLELLDDLTFRGDHIVLSLAAGIRLLDLTPVVAPAKAVHRSIPLPPIEQGIGPVPLFPKHLALETLLSRVGTVIAVETETQFDALSAGSALMAAFFALEARVAVWLETQGVPKVQAADYATSLYHSLAVMAADTDAGKLQGLAQECLTPGGINEQVLKQLQSADWFEDAARALDGIKARFEAG